MMVEGTTKNGTTRITGRTEKGYNEEERHGRRRKVHSRLIMTKIIIIVIVGSIA